MPIKAILIPGFPSVSIFEVLIVFIVASAAYFVVFNNFEKHSPLARRIIKLIIVIGTLSVIGILFGRYIFWSVILLMTAGQVILHAWYFPQMGINGMTAEPYDKYLEVIQEMKGKRKRNKPTP